MSRVVGKPPPSLGNWSLETVLVFGLELVSYEKSRRVKHAKMQHFSARVFFVQIPKCQNSMIYTIFRFFRIQFLKNVLVQIRAGPDLHIGLWLGARMGLAHIDMIVSVFMSVNFH